MLDMGALTHTALQPAWSTRPAKLVFRTRILVPNINDMQAGFDKLKRIGIP